MDALAEAGGKLNNSNNTAPMKPADNERALLLIFLDSNVEPITGFKLVTVWHSVNRTDNTCTLLMDEKGGQQNSCNTTFDEEGLVNAVCHLLDQTDWKSSELARQSLINPRPDILSKSSITRILAHMLSKAGRQDSAATIEEFMTHGYKEL